MVITRTWERFLRLCCTHIPHLCATGSTASAHGSFLRTAFALFSSSWSFRSRWHGALLGSSTYSMVRVLPATPARTTRIAPVARKTLVLSALCLLFNTCSLACISTCPMPHLWQEGRGERKERREGKAVVLLLQHYMAVCLPLHTSALRCTHTLRTRVLRALLRACARFFFLRVCAP